MYCETKRMLLALIFFIPSALPAQQPGLPLDSLVNRASDAFKSGRHEQSIDLFLQSLSRAETEQRPEIRPAILYNLGALHHVQKNYKKSREYVDQALEVSRMERDSHFWANSLMLSGVLYYYEQQPDSSVLDFRRSAEVFEAMGDQARAANALAKVGNILESQGKYAEATPYFTKQFATAQGSGDSLHILYAHINMATNAYNLKRYPEALRYQQIALGMAERFSRTVEYREMLNFGSGVYEAMGQPGKALEILKQYVQVNDSMLNAERTRQVAELEAKYETEKKEATIAQQEQDLKWERTRFWLIAGALLAALLAGAQLFHLTRILRRRNAEKEFLIKEIHHRVKNNLQILSSLLHLQSRQIADEAALDAVRESQNRVDAMSLLHQKLYMGDNLAAVDMPDYLPNLGNALLDSFGLDESERVSIRYHVEPLRLDVDTAVPLGLIINELVTNSLKYAFPGDREGQVEITLKKDEAGRLLLNVADNGVGKDGVSTQAQGTSFGSKLVQMLSQKLGGTPEVRQSESGYATTIRFDQFRIA